MQPNPVLLDQLSTNARDPLHQEAQHGWCIMSMESMSTLIHPNADSRRYRCISQVWVVRPNMTSALVGAKSTKTRQLVSVCMYTNRKGATPTYANDRSWHVNWIASGVTPKPPVTYMCSGKTEVGATNWVQYNGNAIFVDVDTSKCGFSKEPIYVTSIAGKRNHWRTTGSSELYSKTATGFRIYIHRPGITTSDANSWKWHMNWMAAGEGTGSSVVVPCTGQTPVVTDWKYYHKDGIYVDVDTSSCGFIDTPPYVTSLIGKSNHWRSTGSSEVYKISPTGFRTYINWPGLTVAMAKDRRWRINWMAGFTTTTTTTTTVTHLR